jgi:ribosomal protein S18 acetylase RimI-like enzyme
MVVNITDVNTRRASPADADAMALAHRDSIRSIGPRFYPPAVVDDWEKGLTADVYHAAMDRGEVFFIATGNVDGEPTVLGFASDYRIEGTKHGASAYVRGVATRRGIGSTLLHLAEAHAVAHGATRMVIEASLAGVEFYRALGFEEVGRGNAQLMSGRPIACVFMRKDLVFPGSRPER